MSENYISCKAENGSINISEEVISAMVRTAVTEVEGVAGISNTTTGEIAELIGIKSMSKGITVQIIDDTVKVDVIILVRYGCNIVNVAREVQNSVGEVVQAVTGIEKAEIEQLLDRIEQGTAQIETENNLDEEDQKLMEEIRNQVKGARDMTAMAYGA